MTAQFITAYQIEEDGEVSAEANPGILLKGKFYPFVEEATVRYHLALFEKEEDYAQDFAAHYVYSPSYKLVEAA